LVLEYVSRSAPFPKPILGRLTPLRALEHIDNRVGFGREHALQIANRPLRCLRDRIAYTISAETLRDLERDLEEGRPITETKEIHHG